ncbi:MULTISPECIES: oxygen-insensitive NADPH nitroreductase [unclassified Mesobacillus]|uniref:oxygen-insensitive NADPH nitroreductase n=1 Tax=unclassified Mesobacillus TaxID=2675270 RepID=UPI00203C2F06|nr:MULTISPECIES: oxygen-insensitive NADPH nitroreductase [unclassified Mesobacillus]MCM3125419.1 oxygen-insensitive NADPH nitroreductase [Mesobacillus sp. MER 33]MCM3235558.1 oxygen-insensitive NADPH nitroreductase [Mesobacillus sp. MER 48]
MNQVIETILNHRSVRSFRDQTLDREQIEAIVKSAQAASTSSFVQAYSIIGVTDQEKKDRLSEIAGNQAYVAANGHFFVFCADLHRHKVLAEMENVDLNDSIESTEKFMVALIDAALAAQNAAIAAESMGLGICYIGGIRNDLEAVKEVLKTPEHVIPLFGMAVGYPDKETDLKPRLAMEHVYMENEYQQDQSLFEKQLQDYNETTSQYYRERTGGKRADTWTGQMAKMLGRKSRMYMKEFVEKQNLNKK